jgi:hypothetical protein
LSRPGGIESVRLPSPSTIALEFPFLTVARNR